MNDTEKEKRVCWFQLACSRKMPNMPEGWLRYKIESITGGFLVSGCVPDGVFKSGPRKGRPKWDTKKATRIFLTKQDLDAEELRYEAETGKCHNCQGTAKQWASSCRIEGTKYVPCTRCNATGKVGAQ